jgi:soluble cytochrome b562
LYEALSDVNRFSDALKSKLDGIESNATQDQTGAEIQNLYEALSDVNRFSDSDKNDITANALDIDDLQTSVSNLSSTLNQADQDNLEEAKSYAASMAIVFG